MDNVEKALETDLKKTHQQSSVDEFCVDDLLDLSNGFAEDEIEQIDEHPYPNGFNSEKTCFVPFSPQKQLEKIEDFCSLPGSDEFNVQKNGLDSLEWLSQFLEEDFPFEYPAGELPMKNKTETENLVQKKKKKKSFFITPVQTKARTKRARNGGRVWSLGSTTSSASSSSSSSTTTTSVCLNKSAVSIIRRKKTAEKPVQPRRCSHCGVQKTPLWRSGPMGAKTLCNACGVRFKSGRLFPEYRPACSPTFSSEQHSNNHRKILEMRQKREADTGGLDLAQPVQNF